MFYWKIGKPEISFDGYYAHALKQIVPGEDLRFRALSRKLHAGDKDNVTARNMLSFVSPSNWTHSLGFWFGVAMYYAVCADRHAPRFAMKQLGLWHRIKTSPWSLSSANWETPPPARELAELLNQLCSKLRCWAGRNDGSSIFWKGLEYKYYSKQQQQQQQGNQTSQVLLYLYWKSLFPKIC